jgi:hypothetical protein
VKLKAAPVTLRLSSSASSGHVDAWSWRRSLLSLSPIALNYDIHGTFAAAAPSPSRVDHANRTYKDLARQANDDRKTGTATCRNVSLDAYLLYCPGNSRTHVTVAMLLERGIHEGPAVDVLHIIAYLDNVISLATERDHCPAWIPSSEPDENGDRSEERRQSFLYGLMAYKPRSHRL